MADEPVQGFPNGAVARHPHRQSTKMCFGFLRRQRLCWQAELSRDRLGDHPEWHPFLGDGMIGLALGTPLKGETLDARGIVPVHGWPEVLSVSDIRGDALLASHGG